MGRTAWGSAWRNRIRLHYIFGRIAIITSFHIVTFSTSGIALCTMVHLFTYISMILLDMSGEVRFSMYYFVTFITFKSQLYASFKCFFR